MCREPQRRGVHLPCEPSARASIHTSLHSFSCLLPDPNPNPNPNPKPSLPRPAQITHLDGAKAAVSRARQNAARSGLGDEPLRWICEDTTTFISRGLRRGSRFDGLILGKSQIPILMFFGHMPRTLFRACHTPFFRTCHTRVVRMPAFLFSPFHEQIHQPLEGAARRGASGALSATCHCYSRACRDC